MFEQIIDAEYPDKWAMAPETLWFLANEMRQKKPAAILEFGSGVSTAALASLMPPRTVYSVEQDTKYQERTFDLLAKYGLDARVLYTPLAEVEVDGMAVHFYEGLEDRLAPFLGDVRPNFVIIDGPATPTLGRALCLRVIERIRAVPTYVYMDDAVRENERAVVKLWEDWGYKIGGRLEADVGKGLFVGVWGS